ncbi:MAG: HprK-related kinase A [Candidatus Polarisedimenticolaceae bacterium]|nr:HprK-related kinase A [Candidatus Polarisedimenticolaceae bacterium]
MRFGELDPQWLRQQAKNGGISFNTGPFRIQLQTQIMPLLELLTQLYPASELVNNREVADFHIRMAQPRNYRRLWRPQARFYIDGRSHFEPYPLDHAFPHMEWGLNYCIATRAHQYCMLHSAVVARNGRALILPAMPGSGKSTLCAALIHRGWRLLSDEFGLVQPGKNRLTPLPRVIPLKNRSIDIIREFAPEATLGPTFPKTRKGDVAHLAPPVDAILNQDQHPEPAWVVFPKYTPNASSQLEPIPKGIAFIRLANNAFNYRLLGETGYKTLVSLIKSCKCYSFSYSDLESATQTLNALVSKQEVAS